MLDSREPPHGDFVAFVEKIEREQLARAMQPHRLPHLSASGKVVTDDSPAEGGRALSEGEAQRVLQMLKARSGDGTSPPRGAMVGVVLGAALLWHNLRKLRRASLAARGSPQQQVDRVFGRKAAGTQRRGAA